MHIRRATPFPRGQTLVTDVDRNPELGIGLSVLRMETGDRHVDASPLERAFLLVSGRVDLSWDGGPETPIHRPDPFSMSPWVLHVPPGARVDVRGVGPLADVVCLSARQDGSFPSRLYQPGECREEARGHGTLDETATRTVRTVFDADSQPDASLVLGEVITFPGRWSSYPPHHHLQPEIYHYRFNPPSGFGYCGLGSRVVRVREGSTVLIPPGRSHPQAAAPGYAMWYLWVIRHLPGNPYGTPTFEPAHAWTLRPGPPE